MRAQVDARVVDRPVVEDEPAAFDVQAAAQRHELALDDIELTLATRDLAFVGAHRDAAPQPRGQAEGIHVDLVAQHQFQVAGHDPALGRIHRWRADQHLVIRSQHGIGQVGWRQPRIGNQHFAGGVDVATGELEVEAWARLRCVLQAR